MGSRCWPLRHTKCLGCMTHIQGLNRLKGHADTAITGLPNGFALMPPHHVRPIQYRAFPSKRFAVDHFFLISVRDSCPQKTERAAADSGPPLFYSGGLHCATRAIRVRKPEESSWELLRPFRWLVCFLPLHNLTTLKLLFFLNRSLFKTPHLSIIKAVYLCKLNSVTCV